MDKQLIRFYLGTACGFLLACLLFQPTEPVWSLDLLADTPVSLEPSSAVRPPRDHEGTLDVTHGTCLTPRVIPVDSNFISYTDTDSLDVPDNQDPGSCPGAPRRDVFYEFTPIFSGAYNVTLCGGSPPNTLKYQYGNVGCCPSGGSQIEGTCLPMPLPDTLIGGMTYTIEVGSQQDGEQFVYTFTISRVFPPPDNDNCASAFLVIVPSQTLSNNLGATDDVVPNCGEVISPVTAGVWYRVVGTGDSLEATTCSGVSDFDTKLAVYRNSCASLICIGGDDDNPACTFSTNLSTVRWLSVNGTTYYILVGGSGPLATNAFRLDITRLLFDRATFCVQNTTGQEASDLHVTFTWTGGSLYVDPSLVIVTPVGCPEPSVPSNNEEVTNTAVLEWSFACVDAEATVEFVAVTANGPLTFHSGYWTLGGMNIGPAVAVRDTCPPIGRCCYNNDLCADGTESECDALRGFWTQGETCAGNPCTYCSVDLFSTPAGGATYQMMQLPQGFFGSRSGIPSDEFQGIVVFQGVPLIPDDSGVDIGPTDAIIQRNERPVLPTVPSVDTVPIEIVALSLVSVDPITVTFGGGNAEQWLPDVHLSMQPQPQGTMTIYRDCVDGGRFCSALPVQPLFIFRRVVPADPIPPIYFDTYGVIPPIQFDTENGHWRSTDPGFNIYTSPGGFTVDHDGIPFTPGKPICASADFFPGLRDDPCGTYSECRQEPQDEPTPGLTPPRKRLTYEQSLLASHGIVPSQPPDFDCDLDHIPDDADNCAPVRQDSLLCDPQHPDSADYNPLQEDRDDDGVGDLCDNCPDIYNPSQIDFDDDGIGDVCEQPGDPDSLTIQVVHTPIGDGLMLRWQPGPGPAPLGYNIYQSPGGGTGEPTEYIGSVEGASEIFLGVDTDMFLNNRYAVRATSSLPTAQGDIVIDTSAGDQTITVAAGDILCWIIRINAELFAYQDDPSGDPSQFEGANEKWCIPLGTTMRRQYWATDSDLGPSCKTYPMTYKDPDGNTTEFVTITIWVTI